MTIELQGRQFTCAYPTVGQFIDIKTAEVEYSKGAAKSLLTSGLVEEQTAYLFIRALACIQSLFPEVKEELKIKELKDLALPDFSEIYKVYLEVVSPWLSSWMDKFNEALEKK